MGSFSVLVIDDDPDILRAAELELRSAGWTIATTANPKDGAKLVRTLRPNVIVCDASKPKFSGARMIALLKNDPATAGIPVVLLTDPKELRAAIKSAAARKTPPIPE